MARVMDVIYQGLHQPLVVDASASFPSAGESAAVPQHEHVGKLPLPLDHAGRLPQPRRRTCGADLSPDRSPARPSSAPLAAGYTTLAAAGA
jgi:hypothetical protein